MKLSVMRVNSRVFEFCSYCMIGVYYCPGYGLCTCLFLIIEAFKCFWHLLSCFSFYVYEVFGQSFLLLANR
ncbi:hypothetical protein GLYMA_12G056600v4 [Glycine max]|uniref:Uncharacterized protein n=1 Tax=Glycine max TaxID=3847 RepID=K7LT86_SOYBN|nr:hypothetical protein GYH30_032811 [Glycine max]KRH24693.1 hypothetical protein GLYMA_12G056600v4 [Glycine max]